jgi:uncharacterized protein (DUF1330 family)
MPAYVVVDVEITDPQAYEKYKNLAPASLDGYGGSYVARGGHTEVLEGIWAPKRLVILKFESVDRAKQWLGSEEYRAAKEIRHRAATTSMVVVEGLS